MAKKVMFIAVLVGLMLSLVACNDNPVTTVKQVVDCYNDTGLGTTCAYKAVKGEGLVVDGDEPIFALIGLIALVCALSMFGGSRKQAIKAEYRRYDNANLQPGHARRNKNW